MAKILFSTNVRRLWPISGSGVFFCPIQGRVVLKKNIDIRAKIRPKFIFRGELAVCRTRCIVKGGAQKNPLFLAIFCLFFFFFSQERLFSENSTKINKSTVLYKHPL